MFAKLTSSTSPTALADTLADDINQKTKTMMEILQKKNSLGELHVEKDANLMCGTFSFIKTSRLMKRLGS